MPNDPKGDTSDTLLGVLVTVLSVLVVGLLALVSYLYLQLRKIHQQYRELLQESNTASALYQRIHEQRKSAILHMTTKDDLEQQRDQYASSSTSQNSIYSMNTLEFTRPALYHTEITSIEPGSPENEPWAIRKVRSIERLTGLTNEISLKSDRRDPFSEPTVAVQDQDHFHDHKRTVEDDIIRASASTSATKDGKIESWEISKEMSMNAKPTQASNVEACSQRVSGGRHETEAMDPSLLAVPHESCPTRTQSLQSTTVKPSGALESLEPESNIPPHARSPTPQSSASDVLSQVDGADLTLTDIHGDASPGADNFEHCDAYEIPRPFLERSFSLNLAYSDPTAVPRTKGRYSPGTKLKHYLKNARVNRLALGNAQGGAPNQPRSPAEIVSKAKRERFRLPKPTREQNTLQSPGTGDEGVPQDKLATIQEF
ncbi:hypothetical protein TWF718_002075 [Orbilia javanica]|uniref:Uncharacterized protein n=1 Tax=Orbilia javanica TaxID=47235 RepID=A0AAN8NIY7_9PEZI